MCKFISLPNILALKARNHIQDIHRSVHVLLLRKMHEVPCAIHIHATAPFLLRATSLQCAESNVCAESISTQIFSKQQYFFGLILMKLTISTTCFKT